MTNYILKLVLAIGLLISSSANLLAVKADIQGRIADQEREAARERIRLDQLEQQELRAQEEQARRIKDKTAELFRHVRISYFIESIDFLLECLQDGVPVDTCDDEGNTLLHLAALKGHNLTITTLLAKNAPVNALNADGKTPLDVALTAKFAPSDRLKETIAALLAHGANKQPFITRLKSIGTNVHDYAYEDNIQAPLILPHIDAADIATVEHKDLPLFLLVAVKYGYDGLAEIILKRDKSLANTTNAKGESCLLVATKNNSTKTALVLLNYGADHTPTILARATENGNRDIIKELLNRGAQHTPDLLHKAIMHNHVEVVRLFIKNGADVNQIYDQDTPLMHAAYYGQLECAKLLLKHGADINKENDGRETALHQAIEAPYSYRRNLIPMAHLLLTRGAAVNTGTVTFSDECPMGESSIPLVTASNIHRNRALTLIFILAGADTDILDSADASEEAEYIKKIKTIRDALTGCDSIPADLELEAHIKEYVHKELINRRNRKKAQRNALKLLQENNTFTDILPPLGIDALVCDYADLTLYDHAALDIQGQVAPALKISTITPNDILIRSELSALIYDYASEIDAQKSTKQSTTEGTAQNARAMP